MTNLTAPSVKDVAMLCTPNVFGSSDGENKQNQPKYGPRVPANHTHPPRFQGINKLRRGGAIIVNSDG
jgi:hypothetical protein